jgi:hypothetical protein
VVGRGRDSFSASRAPPENGDLMPKGEVLQDERTAGSKERSDETDHDGKHPLRLPRPYRNLKAGNADEFFGRDK